MEELSIEEKAKAYDMALDKIERLLDIGDNCSRKELEHVFPELRESEDEEIRKELIAHIKWCEDNGYCAKEEMTRWITFLEKQGEQKPIDKIQIGKEYKCIASPRYSTFFRGEIYKPEDEFLCNLMNFCSDCFEPIEDGEQKPVEPQQDMLSQEKYAKAVDECIYGEHKPADKAEPKFHEGEWITNGDYTWKIVEVKPLDYILQSQDGNIVDDTISHVDEQFHSFAIEDAKDGDVLHCWIDGDEFVLIYKGVKDGYITTYGHLYQKLKLFAEEPTTMFCRTIQGHFTPATKEQRDTLMKAMTDAGYTFDFEKKELKKIEQKSSWSEEDENRFTNLIFLVKCSKENDATKEGFIKFINKFKSLKDRVQPEQEWSEEDEVELANIVDFLNNPFTVKLCPTLRSNAVNWLKSLKDRITWKPSDGQITVLELASKYERVFTPKQIDILIGLKEQLKELRGK